MGTGPSGETIDTPRHRALGSASRVTILRLVGTADAGLTAGDVAERTGLHFSTVRAHLDRLVEAGLLVKARASGGTPGRPAWRYRAAAAEPAPAPYRTLAAALLAHLATAGGGRPAAVAAGRAWGNQLAAGEAGAAGPVETAVAVLDRLGFDPRREPGTAEGEVEVHLRTCPFLELVGQQPDVMCALHAGMISGVLRRAGAPDGEAVLEPFAAPNACVARLRGPDPSAGAGSR
ncbi:helix-turn-helix domain-containing protein [Phytohabitans sp. ZYX-F-186]|uniref:Helix-turn-helix domain-containing protein n=1 Tax=Phytohabitans maris TaxID=3071409 RepID=A0ABU0ZMX0_9ACTN|nr:helix-turn-helix domain-containing protein [Phytohabitans sp. ZYX-F-186]MDQ7908303.1 helix-turn-helix domain-containing protein [Phytohabitans sp. ZYX-F-186]